MTDSWKQAPVSQSMTGNVIRIGSDKSLLDAQTLMTQAKLTRLVVTDRSGKLYGLITRRDVVRFLSSDRSSRPLDSIKVREAASAPAITLRPTDDVSTAAKIMSRKGISSIVVTDDAGEILGIITKTDLCFYFSISKSTQKAGEYMTRKVYTARPTHSIFFVASLMARQGISRIPVVADGVLRGMITLYDIVRTAPALRPEPARMRGQRTYTTGVLIPTAKLAAMTALDVMTTKVITVTPDEPMPRAAELMIENGISGLPVVDEKGRLRGIVTKTDIVRAIT